jgi:hypothetical protein
MEREAAVHMVPRPRRAEAGQLSQVSHDNFSQHAKGADRAGAVLRCRTQA